MAAAVDGEARKKAGVPDRDVKMFTPQAAAFIDTDNTADAPRRFWDDRTVARRRGSVSIALVLLALAVLGVGIVAAALGPMSGVLASQQSGQVRTATATVVTSVPCGASTTGDVVEIQAGGATRQAHLDGCGHTQGERIQVQIPPGTDANAADPNLIVRQYSPGLSASGGSGSLSTRLNWVLLTLAAIAGGGYLLLLRSRPA